MSTPYPPDAQPDPFTAVFRKVHDHMKGHAPIAALVKPGNHPDFSAVVRPKVEEKLNSNQLPRLVMLPQRARPAGGNSKVIAFEYGVIISLAVPQIDVETMNGLLLDVMIALSPLNEDLGLSFVRSWTQGEAVIRAFTATESEYGTAVIVAQLPLTFALYFDRAAFASWYQPTN